MCINICMYVQTRTHAAIFVMDTLCNIISIPIYVYIIQRERVEVPKSTLIIYYGV